MKKRMLVGLGVLSLALAVGVAGCGGVSKEKDGTKTTGATNSTAPKSTVSADLSATAPVSTTRASARPTPVLAPTALPSPSQQHQKGTTKSSPPSLSNPVTPVKPGIETQPNKPLGPTVSPMGSPSPVSLSADSIKSKYPGNYAAINLLYAVNRSSGAVSRYTDPAVVVKWAEAVGFLELKRSTGANAGTGTGTKRTAEPAATAAANPGLGVRDDLLVTLVSSDGKHMTISSRSIDFDAGYSYNDGLSKKIAELFTMPESPNDQVEKECRQLAVDLNGDSLADVITFCGQKGDYELKLQVNGKEYAGLANNLTGSIAIVDLDKSDRYREIAIPEEGPSSDPKTMYFSIDEGGNVISLGKIQGSGSSVTLNGDGTLVTSRQRGQILQTWFHEQDYRLTADRKLEAIPRALYDMNTEVTVLKSFALLKDKGSAETGWTLQPGDKVLIKSSDDIAWCLVVSKDGSRQGWFEVEDFVGLKGSDLQAFDVFEGLSYAN
ncbi:hypothetical protein [Gorillibacterium massiliense]|uniref:hypothetical protein n=1 Tax=Gorillibacterium massiliense TaxID=1280390 RepID=UPI0005942A73|nr:hypothetical protein [Gorillibacterium massiliense]